MAIFRPPTIRLVAPVATSTETKSRKLASRSHGSDFGPPPSTCPGAVDWYKSTVEPCTLSLTIPWLPTLEWPSPPYTSVEGRSGDTVTSTLRPEGIHSIRSGFTDALDTFLRS